MSGGSLACKCLQGPDNCKKCLDVASYCAFCSTGESGGNGCIESSFDNEDACKGYIDFSSDCPDPDLRPLLRAVKK